MNADERLRKAAYIGIAHLIRDLARDINRRARDGNYTFLGAALAGGISTEERELSRALGEFAEAIARPLHERILKLEQRLQGEPSTEQEAKPET